MLAPQFTLRRLLALVTLSGFVCLMVAAAMSGRMWAISVVIALLGLVVTILVHSLLFVATWGIAAAMDRGKRRKTTH
jgi:hypothetical protein